MVKILIFIKMLFSSSVNYTSDRCSPAWGLIRADILSENLREVFVTVDCVFNHRLLFLSLALFVYSVCFEVT
jgi:hypothetical protein